MEYVYCSIRDANMRQASSHDGLPTTITPIFKRGPRINVALSLTRTGDCGGGLFVSPQDHTTWVRVIVIISHSNPCPRCIQISTQLFILFSEPKLRDLLGLGLRLGGSREGFDYSPRFRFGPREFAISYAESALTKIVSLLRPATGHCTRGAYQRRATACRSARHHTLKKTSSPGNCGSEGGVVIVVVVWIYIYIVCNASLLWCCRVPC